MSYVINIGLHNPVTNTFNTVDQVLEVLGKYTDFSALHFEVKQSVTEPTFVCTINNTRITKVKAALISDALGQDCIAVYNTDTELGYLAGHKAAEWGSFNPEYFLF